MLRIDRAGWSYLRGALLFLGATGALGALSLAGSIWHAQAMERQRLDHEQARHAAEQRYLTLDHQAQLIADYLAPFVNLYATGLLGREQRLRWVEVLQETGVALQLPALDYEIAAQRPYTAQPPSGSSDYKVFVSAMRLDMQLLHEGDLAALLLALKRRGKGLYTVSECALERNFTRLTDSLQVGNLSGSCLLHWFSLRRSGQVAQALEQLDELAGRAPTNMTAGAQPARAEDRLGRLFTTTEQRRYLERNRRRGAQRRLAGALPAGMVARRRAAPARRKGRTGAALSAGAKTATFEGFIYRQDGTRLTLFNKNGAGADQRALARRQNTADAQTYP